MQVTFDGLVALANGAPAMPEEFLRSALTANEVALEIYASEVKRLVSEYRVADARPLMNPLRSIAANDHEYGRSLRERAEKEIGARPVRLTAPDVLILWRREYVANMVKFFVVELPAIGAKP